MKKIIIRIIFCVALISIVIVLGIMYKQRYQESENVVVLDEQLENAIGIMNNAITLEDEDSTWNESSAINVDLNSLNNSYNIVKSGTYVFSGNLKDGSIVVDAQDNEDIVIVLKNANIKSLNSSPIYIKNAKSTKIILEGENYLEDTSDYVYDDNENYEPDSTIFSKDDLIINGSGKLTIKSNFNDAIKSKDDLKIINCSIDITSVDDAIVGKDLLAIKNSNIIINSSGDGIKSTNDTDVLKGNIVINGGNITITSTLDAIDSENKLIISSGTFNLLTGGGSINSTSKKNDDWGKWRKQDITTNEEDTAKSTKGIKSKNNMTITDGNFVIDSSDDSVHSNGNVILKGGTFVLNSGDDGIHSDSSISIENVNINIEKSYEGIEGSYVTILSGKIDVVASDDGINISGGNDGSSVNGRIGQNSFEQATDGYLKINGGNIIVNAVGDGLDSNGLIYMTAGTVTVYGPTNNGNGALDYAGSFEISGGTLIALGSSGMAQTPSDTSTQYSLSINGTYNEGTNIKIKDSEEKSVIEVTALKNCQSIIISTPDIQKDKEYSIYVNDVLEEKVTITGIITKVGNVVNIYKMEPMGDDFSKFKPDGDMKFSEDDGTGRMQRQDKKLERPTDGEMIPVKPEMNIN